MQVCLAASLLTRNPLHRTGGPLEYRNNFRHCPRPSPSEMPQHAMGDKPFALTPPLAFASRPPAPDEDRGRPRPSQHAPLDLPLSQDALCPPAHGPPDPCSPLLRQPRGGRCGWGAVAPACLQPFNTPRGFLLFLCSASFLQGMTVNGFVNTVVTSIERRFDLRSYESGLVASTYDLAACLCLAFVGYFGGRGHKPRWLGWGVLTMGLGSLVFALPHFGAGPYAAKGDAGAGACPANRSAACGPSASGLSGYRLVFMLGQFLHGVGATPLYTLGVTFLDENVKSSCSPVYIGECGREGRQRPARPGRASCASPAGHTWPHVAPDAPGEAAAEPWPASGPADPSPTPMCIPGGPGHTA